MRFLTKKYDKKRNFLFSCTVASFFSTLIHLSSHQNKLLSVATQPIQFDFSKMLLRANGKGQRTKGNGKGMQQRDFFDKVPSRIGSTVLQQRAIFLKNFTRFYHYLLSMGGTSYRLDYRPFPVATESNSQARMWVRKPHGVFN